MATGPAISKPVIRGLGYNRVLTINDGVRQEGQQWGDEHGIEVDDASVNKIELLKGRLLLFMAAMRWRVSSISLPMCLCLLIPLRQISPAIIKATTGCVHLTQTLGAIKWL